MDNKNLLFESLPDFLTVKELKQYLRIGTNKAYELAKRKDFPSIRFGNRKIFPKYAVKEWIDRECSMGRLPKKLRVL